MRKSYNRWRSAFAFLLLAAVLPVPGAIAGSADDSGTDVVFFNPARGAWQFVGGDFIYYGVPGDTALFCDWDGDGVASVGVYRESTGEVFLRDTNQTGIAEHEFYFGIGGDRPLCGDWDGDGVETVAVFRPSERTFYLRNTNDQGFANVDFEFGFATGEPFAGDWDGDGVDTVGLRDPGNGFISLASGPTATDPILEDYFGGSDGHFLVGDWNGDGKDRFGYHYQNLNLLAVAGSLADPDVAAEIPLDGPGVPLGGEWDKSTGILERAVLLQESFNPPTDTTTTTNATQPPTTTTTTSVPSSTTTTNPDPQPTTTTTTSPPPTTTTTEPPPTTTTTTTTPAAPPPTTTTTTAPPPPTTTTTTTLPGPPPGQAQPGVEGFGASSVGGRGGVVLEVTNLNDSGPGSLRAAVEASGRRMVVFRVGGTIELSDGLDLDDPYITIAGQTAPGDGITVKNGSSDGTVLGISTHDVIVSHVRFRPGPGGNGDAVTIAGGGAYDVVLDHVSMSWAVDENFSTYLDAHNITVQWSIISEALTCSTHPEGCHGMGALLGSAGGHSMSLHHNLLAHNSARNLRVQADGVIDLVNNVIYNPGFSGGYGPSHVRPKTDATIRVNYVGNYYKPGANSGSADYLVSASGGTHRIYLADNLVPNDVIRSSDSDSVVSTRHSAPPVTTTSPQVAYNQVLANAGASLGLACDGTPYQRRDPVDARIITDVTNGTGSYIDHPNEVGGWPTLASGTPCADTDHDGMPNQYETRYGLNPNQNDSTADPNNNGLTNLEEYLNGTNPSSLYPAFVASATGARQG